MSLENPKTKNELFLLVKEKQTKQEFEDNIVTLQNEFGNLIDEDAAALLLVDKLGCNNANVVQLAEVHPGQEATVQGIITSIQPVRSFSRKNGREGKVANLLISDQTGTLAIVFWNDDALRVESGEFQKDMKIKIINGYTKQGRHGVELHVGRWSSISVEAKDASDEEIVNNKQQTDKNHDSNEMIKGTILSISPTNVFLKKDETYGFVCKVHVKTTRGIELITVWDNQVKNLQEFNKGDTVEFSYLDVKKINDHKEYHANGKASITLC
jgi:replication factor A1